MQTYKARLVRATITEQNHIFLPGSGLKSAGLANKRRGVTGA